MAFINTGFPEIIANDDYQCCSNEQKTIKVIEGTKLGIDIPVPTYQDLKKIVHFENGNMAYKHEITLEIKGLKLEVFLKRYKALNSIMKVWTSKKPRRARKRYIVKVSKDINVPISVLNRYKQMMPYNSAVAYMYSLVFVYNHCHYRVCSVDESISTIAGTSYCLNLEGFSYFK